MKFRTPVLHLLLCMLLFLAKDLRAGENQPVITDQGIVEWTVESRTSYNDPFNDVDIDVIFQLKGKSWKVPMFWRGSNRWTVRFAPPTWGEYAYRLESSDQKNPDLNGHAGTIKIQAYGGNNSLLKKGMIRVSTNRRYFEHSDGTPFYWLGDTWYSGLSDRIDWEGFKQLTVDRKAKGFTVVMVSVMPPSNEEIAPIDPGFSNEGGAIWDPEFKRINPAFFDYADRRVQNLVNHGIAPAIVGAWRQVLAQMGVPKMKKHWRYIIARYGAYPVFWVTGGELYDPPASRRLPGLPYGATIFELHSPGWTEVARYIKTTDPYHHPLTAHEIDPPYDNPLQDEFLTDFDLFQAGHRGWASIATEVALLNKHYARINMTKPLVIGEIGYEGLNGANLEDYQRAAFWLAMLNGAAGFTFGNISIVAAYSAEKPWPRIKYSQYSWKEGMNFRGATQVALGATLLKTYQWWKIVPHPEWVTPNGTTLLEPNENISGFNIDLIAALTRENPPENDELPLGEWHEKRGNIFLPYAAGVAREVRFIYLPYFGFKSYPEIVVKGLEPDVEYFAYYWEPALGIKIDLGIVSHGELNITQVNQEICDPQGGFRGKLQGSRWGEDRQHQQKVSRGAYQPARPPSGGDWLLVLEAKKNPAFETRACTSN
jgi:Protein of unknown function (DUF4038)/Domain of unknown function (DUF5060)